METSHLSLGEKTFREEEGSKVFYRSNPAKFSQVIGRTNSLAEPEVALLKEVIQLYQSFKIENSPNVREAPYTLSSYATQLHKKSITSIAEVQLILNILTVEVVFFHYLKKSLELLTIQRSTIKKYENFEEAVAAYRVFRFDLTTIVGLPKEGSTPLTEAMYYRFRDRNFMRGFLEGDREFLTHVLDKGNENEKSAAEQLFKALTQTNNYKLLDLYNEKLAALTRALGPLLKANHLFKSFFCLSAFRFKLFNLEIDELLEEGKAVIKAKNDIHYFTFIHSDLDVILLEKNQLLEEWKLQRQSLIELYKKVYVLGKEIIHNKVDLYQKWFKNLFANVRSVEWPPLLEAPDSFEKKMAILFPEQRLELKPHEKLPDDTVKEVKEAKGHSSKKKSQRKKKEKREISKNLTEKKADEGQKISTATSLIIPFTFTYAPRVLRWWKEGVPAEYDGLSPYNQNLQKTFHSFSRQVDNYVLNYGIKAQWPNGTTHALDTIYLLPGTILFKENGDKARGVFTYCMGKDKLVYHRYFSRNLEIYSLPEVDSAFRFFDFPTLTQTIALDSRSEEQKITQTLSEKGKDSVFYDPILQTIQIEDALNQATITLFWTPEKGTEMELLNPLQVHAE